MSSVHIHLDNYDNIFYAGQTLVGRVECFLNTKKYIRAIRINISGTAETEWEERDSYYDEEKKKHESRNVRHYAEEKYFNAEYSLLQGGEDFQLPAGTYSYPFSYILPSHIPSSYEGRYGKIRYCLKATVYRPGKSDYEDNFCLNLISPLDLNTIPGLSDPVNISVDKTVCSCWCSSRGGALRFDMSVPATGFVPGQEVSVGAHIENMTNINVEGVKFKIVGHVEFISQYPSKKNKYEEVMVTECRESGVGAHGEKSWTSNLRIPANQFYPNLNYCGIINIMFRLKGKVLVPSPHTNLESEIPVTIGTIPLNGVNITFTGAPPPQLGFHIPPTAPTHEGSFITPPYPINNNPYPPQSDEVIVKNPMTPYPVSSAPSAPVFHESPGHSSKGAEFGLAPPSYDEANQ